MSLTNLIAAIRNAFPKALQDQAFVDLMALDDHSLSDIGLRRAGHIIGRRGGSMPDAPAAARQGATPYGSPSLGI